MESYVFLLGNVLSFLVLMLAITRQYAIVSAGPDHAILERCLDIYKSLKPEQRHITRNVVQDLQAIESYLGQLQHGGALPESSMPQQAPNVARLEEWKAQNITKLQHVLINTEVGTRLGISDIGTVAVLASSCMSSRLLPDRFMGRPEVSVLLNYFMRPSAVTAVTSKLRNACGAAGVVCELIVNVDNPQEVGAWAAEAGFVVPVFSANLHEARGYNRAARMARGKYLVIWQDDQFPPPNGKWVLNLITLFEAYPMLGVIGMNSYRLCKLFEATNHRGVPSWEPDPKTGVVWSYAQTVDFAPLAVRASLFHAVGGLDESISRSGDCGIWADWELSTRVWLDGWQVGFMALEGRSGDTLPGTTHQGSNGEKCWGRQQHVAMWAYKKRYGIRRLEMMMCEKVWQLNMITFSLAKQKQCPYGLKGTEWANCSGVTPEAAAALSAELAEMTEAAAAWGRGGFGSSVSLDHLAPTRTSAEHESKRAEQAAGASGDTDNREQLSEPLAPSLLSAGAAEESRHVEGLEASGVGGDGVVIGPFGTVEINPVLVRTAAASSSGRRLGRRRVA